MAADPATYENIKTVPLTVKLSPRDATLAQDAWMKNIFLEQADDGPYSVKRPGLKFYKSNTGFGLSSYQLGGQGLLGAQPGLCLIYGQQLLVLISPIQFFTPGGGTTFTAPSGQLAQDRYRFGVQSAIGILHGFTAWQGSSRYVYTLGRLGNPIEYFLTGAPAGLTLLPSLCNLDNTWYVLDSSGTIWASALSDITTWPALNSVLTGNLIGTPAALWRHLSYLIAFGSSGLAVYYDAAISPGAPLALVPNGTSQIGMPVVAALSLAEFEDTLYFLANAQGEGLAVYQQVGLQIAAVSTPAVNRILTAYGNLIMQDNAAAVTGARAGWPVGTAFRSAGHDYYMLTMPTYTNGSSIVRSGITLVYDIMAKEWYIWTQQTVSGEREWQAAGVIGSEDFQVWPDRATGQLCTLDEFTYQDNSLPVNVMIQTDAFSWGNQRIKLIAATYPLLDVVNSSVTLSWTDDDYQTFSTPQSISTVTSKKQLIRCGSTVRRAWKIVHTDNTPMRFYQLEVEVLPGAL